MLKGQAAGRRTGLACTTTMPGRPWTGCWMRPAAPASRSCCLSWTTGSTSVSPALPLSITRSRSMQGQPRLCWSLLVTVRPRWNVTCEAFRAELVVPALLRCMAWCSVHCSWQFQAEWMRSWTGAGPPPSASPSAPLTRQATLMTRCAPRRRLLSSHALAEASHPSCRRCTGLHCCLHKLQAPQCLGLTCDIECRRRARAQRIVRCSSALRQFLHNLVS